MENIKIIEGVLNNLEWPALFTLIVLIIKTAVDTFNITGIERKLLSDSEKILANLSQIALFSLFFSILFYNFLVTGNVQNNESSPLNLFLITYTITFLIFSFFVMIIFPIVNFFRIKVSYSVIIGSIKWEIVKKVDNSKILLRNEELIKLVNSDYILNKKIASSINTEEVEENYYTFLNYKWTIALRIVFLILLMILTFVSFSFIEKTVTVIRGLILLLVFYITITIIILTFVIGSDNRKILIENLNDNEKKRFKDKNILSTD